MVKYVDGNTKGIYLSIFHWFSKFWKKGYMHTQYAKNLILLGIYTKYIRNYVISSLIFFRVAYHYSFLKKNQRWHNFWYTFEILVHIDKKYIKTSKFSWFECLHWSSALIVKCRRHKESCLIIANLLKVHTLWIASSSVTLKRIQKKEDRNK